MADFTQSAEELLTKLDTYREQLAQVEEALETQPDEPSLSKLKNDLQEVIALTEDLVKYQAAAPEEREQVPEPVQQQVPQQRQSSSHKSVHTALIGRTCECFYENKWYNAEIVSVRRDERGIERCSVEFIGYQNQREYKINDIRMLKPPHPATCQPGIKCQAVFSEDGLWYECIITEQTEKGYKVTFTEGGKEEVKFDQVRVGSKIPEKKRTIREVTTPAGYKIPESLQVTSADSEDLQEAKKRKIHAIKSSQRTDKVEKDALKKQAGWQKFFHTKASIRSKTGFLSGKPKQSIFAVPDEIEGKVGVTGSGKGMTEFQERQKFSYQFV
jgi:hypothetical protein